MKNKFNQQHDIQKNVLRLAAFVGVILGAIITLSPSFVLEFFHANIMDQNPLYEFLQIYGIALSVFGIGYIIASIDPYVHWQFILMGMIFKLFSSYIFIKSLLLGTMNNDLILVALILNLIWIVPFYFILVNVFNENTQDMTSPLVTKDLVKYVRTSKNENLIEMSYKKNILLVFVRQFGCAFSQETVYELAKVDSIIRKRNLEVVFVHMSDNEYADDFFNKFYANSVHHISDPSRTLYKSFNLKRGSFTEIYSVKAFLKSIYLVLFKGFAFGMQEGDGMQLGGAFLISNGEVLLEDKADSKDYVFDIKKLNKLELF